MACKSHLGQKTAEPEFDNGVLAIGVGQLAIGVRAEHVGDLWLCGLVAVEHAVQLC